MSKVVVDKGRLLVTNPEQKRQKEEATEAGLDLSEWRKMSDSAKIDMLLKLLLPLLKDAKGGNGAGTGR